MAKVKFSKFLEYLRGKAGGFVIRRRPDGTFIFSGAPTYKKNRGTPKQKAHWQHVSEVTKEARVLARIHPIYAELAAEDVARGKWMSAYNFAFADCMKPPVIHRIERREGLIRVQATDNIGITKVRVTVTDENGKTLESGNAIRAEGDWWEYALGRKAGGSWQRPSTCRGTVRSWSCSRAPYLTKIFHRTSSGGLLPGGVCKVHGGLPYSYLRRLCEAPAAVGWKT